MYSSNLKAEERDKLFNTESLYTLKLLIDVAPSLSCYLAQSTADRISTIDTQMRTRSLIL